MCLLVDQQLREGISVPFFGHPARTSISHIKIAIKKNVPIMYMRTERLHGCRFRVTISAPIFLNSSGWETISKGCNQARPHLGSPGDPTQKGSGSIWIHTHVLGKGKVKGH